ncbi:hypothetical protein LMG24238_02963 [Paraburkholderia sediminicola]|uniref:Uncharacterized protein n=1 Tax=Paraburkholderia sediminicola TaxID=458836 RepID=A0A6J5B1N2_9BURK|nr:hypothetical protein [Paraburkholderia sediminicola]CAB3687984.1 hypothetical protein LMG24238_02963 [Paraburkholderia sediminicola]
MSTIYQQASAIIDYARDHRRSVCTCDKQDDTAASHHQPGCRYRTFVEASVTLDELSSSKPAVPEGWKLVPMEPTNAMTFVGQKHRYEPVWSIGAIYREMLAASPVSPAQSGKPVAMRRICCNIRRTNPDEACADCPAEAPGMPPCIGGHP